MYTIYVGVLTEDEIHCNVPRILLNIFLNSEIVIFEKIKWKHFYKYLTMFADICNDELTL